MSNKNKETLIYSRKSYCEDEENEKQSPKGQSRRRRRRRKKRDRGNTESDRKETEDAEGDDCDNSGGGDDGGGRGDGGGSGDGGENGADRGQTRVCVAGGNDGGGNGGGGGGRRRRRGRPPLRRMYGWFHCNQCNRHWESSYVWCVRAPPADSPFRVFYKQKCEKCRIDFNPYDVDFLICSQCGRRACVCEDRHVDDRKSHREDLCGRCLSGDRCQETWDG